MNKLVSSLLATTLAASFAVATMAPAAAVPLPAQPIQAAPAGTTSDVMKVDYADQVWRRHGNRHWRGDRGRTHYWRGHRGYDRWRPGYRRHGDFWFPLAAFATGAIISGAIANDRPPPRVYRGDSAHVRWCYDRYRSYRASDNTFQPYHGPRQQCVSPY